MASNRNRFSLSFFFVFVSFCEHTYGDVSVIHGKQFVNAREVLASFSRDSFPETVPGTIPERFGWSQSLRVQMSRRAQTTSTFQDSLKNQSSGPRLKPARITQTQTVSLSCCFVCSRSWYQRRFPLSSLTCDHCACGDFSRGIPQLILGAIQDH